MDIGSNLVAGCVDETTCLRARVGKCLFVSHEGLRGCGPQCLGLC
jgi:hypothetical protein